MDLFATTKRPVIRNNSILKEIEVINQKELKIHFKHNETAKEITHQVNADILATGYKQRTPSFLEPLKNIINWEKADEIKVKKNYAAYNRSTIFIQNAELHSHGFNSADLGLSPYRNVVILNSILGKEYFSVDLSGNILQLF